MGGDCISSDAIAEIARRLIHGVREIDFASTRLEHGVECGVARIDLQFYGDVRDGFRERLPRHLEAEDIISLCLQERFCQSAKLWEKYPRQRRKTCDLVIPLSLGSHLWVEVKQAIKSYFDCDGTCRTGKFKPYLFGAESRTHSAADDIQKLMTLAPRDAHLGFLLIGFDSTKTRRSPMDDAIQKFDEMAARKKWILEKKETWADRRNSLFRINCFFWRHLPMRVRSFTD